MPRSVTTGRLASRRDFLKGTLAAALLAACGWSDDDEQVGEEATTTAEATTDSESPATTTPAASETATATTAPSATPRPTNTATPLSSARTFRIVTPFPAYTFNPHLGPPVRVGMAARLALEPLFDFDADLKPVLSLGAEWPTLDNGLLNPDGRWVIWRLREDVKWHDGEDFNAEDVAFTWEFIIDILIPATTQENYEVIERIDILDSHTVQLHFREPHPGWIDLFRGAGGVILPEHIFRPYLEEPPAIQYSAGENVEIVGTGPWRIFEADVTTGDAGFERFDGYWDVGKPNFDVVEIRGGGDAEAAARRVLETGNADWAMLLEAVDPSC